MGQTVFSQALDLWINPEIDRRRNAGRIQDGFELNAAQVLFPSPLDARENVIRLNEEVHARARVKAARAVAEGESLFESDIDDLDLIALEDRAEANSGHLTMIRIRNRWFIGFDFRRDRQRAQRYLNRAEDFLKAARLCFRHKLESPGIDNLYSSAELAAKAELLVFMAYVPARPRDLKDHGFVRGRYGRWTGLGNAQKSSNSALNRLSRLRPAARYLEGNASLRDKGRLLRVVGQMIRRIQRQLGEIQ